MNERPETPLHTPFYIRYKGNWAKGEKFLIFT